MFRKMTIVMVAVGLVGALAAGCAGQVGKGEGESCSRDEDCNNQLFCQPVQGRQGDFCCPAPATASGEANCHPTNPLPGQ